MKLVASSGYKNKSCTMLTVWPDIVLLSSVSSYNPEIKTFEKDSQINQISKFQILN